MPSSGAPSSKRCGRSTPSRRAPSADGFAAVRATAGFPRLEQVDALLGRVTHRLAQGRYQEAAELLHEADRIAPGHLGNVEGLALHALMRSTVGDTVRAAARRLTARAEIDWRLSGTQLAAWATALDGDTAGTSLIQERFPSDLLPEYCEALLQGVRGLAAAHRGDSASARLYLAAALGVVPYTGSARLSYPGLRFALELARLERAAGDLTSAANRLAFRSFATRLVLLRAEAEELRAQIAEQQGDTVSAIRAYRNFIELWKDADPELQPRVATAREAVARLER